jgi:hypothetical protein
VKSQPKKRILEVQITPRSSDEDAASAAKAQAEAIDTLDPLSSGKD